MTHSFFKSIRSISQSALLITAGLLATPSYAEQNNPLHLLEKVTNTTFERIESEQQDIKLDPNHIRDIIEQELMPHIDHQFAAFKVLGKHFRDVPKDKIPEYVEEFKLHLVSSFATALESYGGQELVFEPVKYTEKLKSMTIKAIIREASHPDVHISFKLRKNKKTQEWKTYDLTAEGISLLSSKHNEFASIIRQQGIQGVIDVMKKQNSRSVNVASN